MDGQAKKKKKKKKTTGGLLVYAVGDSARGGASLVTLGEEVDGVGGGIEDGGADDPDVVGDVGAADVALQEGRLDLSLVDGGAGDGVDGADPVHARGEKDELLPTGRGVDQRFGVPFLLGAVGVGPEDAEDGGSHHGRMHVMVRQITRLGRIGILNGVGGGKRMDEPRDASQEKDESGKHGC